MKRIITLLSAVLLVVGSANAQATAKDPEAKKILDAASEKFKTFKTFKAEFEFKMESPSGMNESYNGTAKVKGEKFFIKTSDGKENYNNGETVWTYYIEDNEVTIFDYDEEDDNMSIDKMLNMYKSGYKYQLKADETIDGKTYKVVDLEPDLTPEERKLSQVFKIRIWFDKSTHVIHGWKIFEKSGNRYYMTVKKLVPNVPLSDDEFIFDEKKHQGVVVEDLR